MSHDVSFGRYPCFMFYHLTCIRHSHFAFWVHKLKHFLSHCSSWNHPWLDLLKEFWVAFMLISLCSVCFTLERWLLNPLIFCCTACICFLGVINYNLNFVQHHFENNQTLFSTWSAILPAQWVNCNAEWLRANNPTEWSVLSSNYTCNSSAVHTLVCLSMV
jgi:hypothetical protein